MGTGQKEFLTFTEQQKNEVLQGLEKILLYYGGKPAKHNWNCPGSHNKPDEDMTISNKNGRLVCSCHCGIKGDSFSVIAIMENLDIRKDFPKILKKGLGVLGSNIINSSFTNNKAAINKVKKEKNHINFDKYDLTNIITKYFKYMSTNKYNYFFDRGIDNLDLIKKYRIIIENPMYLFPRDLLPYTGYNINAYRFIIPVWYNKKVVNCILRRDDNLSTEGKKTLNLKNLSVEMFNIGKLEKHNNKHMFFVTEGVFDALSFENIEFKNVTGIAINSIVMVNRFLEKVKININQLKENNVHLIGCLDSDNKGKEATKQLKKGLNGLGLNSIYLDFSPYKDANEYYQKNISEFNNKIFKLINYLRKD